MAMNKEQKKAYGAMKQKENSERWFENLSNAITDNKIPWRKPWRGGAASMPRNLVSKKAYRGGNVIQLWVAGMTMARS
jgi:antirestriction protein ArdC